MRIPLGLNNRDGGWRGAVRCVATDKGFGSELLSWESKRERKRTTPRVGSYVRSRIMMRLDRYLPGERENRNADRFIRF